MYSKGFKTILLSLALGFFIIWFLEFRRTTLAYSYWLLLVVLVCLLWYQLISLKMSKSSDDSETTEAAKVKGQKKVVKPATKKRK